MKSLEAAVEVNVYDAILTAVHFMVMYSVKMAVTLITA